MSDVEAVSTVDEDTDEALVCQWCGEDKAPEDFKKNRHGLTRTCKKCHGDRVKETRARKAAKIADQVVNLGRDDVDPDEPEDDASGRTNEVLSELLATIGRACLNAAKRLNN